MKSLSTNRTSKTRQACGVGKLRSALVKFGVRTQPAVGRGFPTSRHMPGVWEAGARSLKPKGPFWTNAELFALSANTDVKYELWDGKIIAMSPARPKHGAVIARLSYYLGAHIYENKTGEIFDGQTGFRLGMEHCI